MTRFTKELSIRQNILYTTILIVFIALFTIVATDIITFNNSTEQIIESSSSEINKQVILNFENYIDSVISTGNYIQEQTVEFGLNDNSEELTAVYESAADIQEDVVSITLLDLQGDVVISSVNKQTFEFLQFRGWFLDANFADEIYHFSSPHTQDLFVDIEDEVITVTKTIDYYINQEKLEGILVIDLNTSKLVKLSQTTNLGEKGHLIILDDDDTLIFSSIDTCTKNECESIEIITQIIVGGKDVDIDNTSMYASVNTLKNTRWRMATFINTEIVSQSRNNSLIVSLIVVVVTLSLSVAASSWISKRISSPINKLMSHMNRIQKGNLYRTIELDGQKEIVVLSDRFNIMIEEIRDLMETVIMEQKEKRKTEFIALQTQINPHFLYNTLDSIMYLSENNMNEKVVQMVVALSKFFRISISRGQSIILLKEELEHAKNYLLIQQIRYHDKFDFIFEIDENILQMKTVKLILQPLIENAIYHGINTEYGKGNIIIRAYQKQKRIYLEVEDDGYGITEEKIAEMHDRMRQEVSQKSVGIRNVVTPLWIY